jgi:hypothetical protein
MDFVVSPSGCVYWIILDYKSSYMLGPICRVIFRLIFEEVERTIDNAFDLRDLVLQETKTFSALKAPRQCPLGRLL